MFEAAKYRDGSRYVWAVYDTKSHVFYDIGKGKSYCMKRARELNEEFKKRDWI